MVILEERLRWQRLSANDRRLTMGTFIRPSPGVVSPCTPRENQSFSHLGDSPSCPSPPCLRFKPEPSERTDFAVSHYINRDGIYSNLSDERRRWLYLRKAQWQNIWVTPVPQARFARTGTFMTPQVHDRGKKEKIEIKRWCC